MGRILVIEDDLTVQRALQHTFEAAGYVVDLCGGPATMQANLKSSVPTAVLLDLCLPLRSGKEICRELKTKYPSLPVVILSAVTDVATRESDSLVLEAPIDIRSLGLGPYLLGIRHNQSEWVYYSTRID